METDNTNSVPVTVLGGFLGAGKTTLLNRILRSDHGLRIGVVVNDFGDVNIDAALVSAVDGGMVDLSNGCVCCTMQGDLIAGVRRLLARRDPPEHLVLETSGIADPAGVVAAFRTPDLRVRTRLDAVITVVDAENARNPRLDPVLVENQIRCADVALINKVDLVDREGLDQLVSWVRELVPDARILRSVRADVPMAVLFGLDVGAKLVSPSENHGAFSAATYDNPAPLAYRTVRAVLEELPPEILRVKGFLYLADAPNMRFVVHKVGRRVAIDVDELWHDVPESQLVLIGQMDRLPIEDIAGRLDACRTTSVALLPHSNFERLRQRVVSSALAPPAPEPASVP